MSSWLRRARAFPYSLHPLSRTSRTPYGTSLLSEGEEKLKKLLEDVLQPSYLHVKDISGLFFFLSLFLFIIRCEGDGSANNCSLGGCGSMYEIVIDSAKFQGKRPVQQHRMVNEVSATWKCLGASNKTVSVQRLSHFHALYSILLADIGISMWDVDLYWKDIIKQMLGNSYGAASIL